MKRVLKYLKMFIPNVKNKFKQNYLAKLMCVFLYTVLCILTACFI